MNASSLSICEGVFALLSRLGLFLLTKGLLALLEGSKASSESAILLLSQVNGRISLLFELSSCSIDSLLAQHGKSLGDVLSNLLDHRKLNLGLGGDLGNAELSKSFLYHAKKNTFRRPNQLSKDCSHSGKSKRLNLTSIGVLTR